MNNDPQQQEKEGLSLIMPLVGYMTSHVRYHVSRICKDVGYELTPEEADTLMIIRHCNGLPQSLLANILGKDKAAVTRLMNSLVGSGLVGRVQDQNDRRVVRAQITEEGECAFIQLWPELKKLSVQALDGISDEDMSRLCELFSKINSNLNTLTEQRMNRELVAKGS